MSRFGDIQGASRPRAYTVAAATNPQLVWAFRSIIDDAIAQGTPLDDFRANFDAIVATTAVGQPH